MNSVVTYCERIHTGAWGEPLNSFSNLAYLLAACWLLQRYIIARGTSTRGPLLLVTLLTLIGFGSAAYHTVPSDLTLLMDVIPIFFFMLALCWQIQGRLLHYSTVARTLTALVLLSSTLYLSSFSELLNGSLMYLPATLLALAAVVLLRHSSQARRLQLAACLLIMALCCRTADNWLCSAIPNGTHFVWHLLTAMACALAVNTLIGHLPPGGTQIKQPAD